MASNDQLEAMDTGPEWFACVCGAEFRSEWERDDHIGRNGCLQIRTA
jgi:hypothetical protein